MERRTSPRRSDSRREAAARDTEIMSERSWLDSSGKLLDERAFLAALGRGGAQRMAIPLQEA